MTHRPPPAVDAGSIAVGVILTVGHITIATARTRTPSKSLNSAKTPTIVKGHLSLSTFLIYNDITMFLCELIFEIYAYRLSSQVKGFHA
jgi:hypothetical protein